MRYSLSAGLGLGLVAAVVFASANTGPLIVRFVLFFITPLPVAIAGFGWGWMTGAIAGAAGATLIGLAAGPAAGAVFAISQVAPMVALTYLAQLSRPLPLPPLYAGAGEPVPLEWYPPGRLAVAAAVMAAGLTLVFLIALGGDVEELRRAVSGMIEAAVKSGLPEGSNQPLAEADLKALTDAAMSVLPGAVAISWTGSLIFNLWLAGRITLASGQLGRPWPDLGAIEFPRGTSLLLCAALLGAPLEGYPGLAATSLAGALILTYVLLGLAVIHYATRGRPWRPFALSGLYALLLVVNVWVGVPIALLGLAEPILHLRARAQAPPPPST